MSIRDTWIRNAESAARGHQLDPDAPAVRGALRNALQVPLTEYSELAGALLSVLALLGKRDPTVGDLADVADRLAGLSLAALSELTGVEPTAAPVRALARHAGVLLAPPQVTPTPAGEPQRNACHRFNLAIRIIGTEGAPGDAATALGALLDEGVLQCVLHETAESSIEIEDIDVEK